jgi:hypothetical protein
MTAQLGLSGAPQQNMPESVPESITPASPTLPQGEIDVPIEQNYTHVPVETQGIPNI